MATVATSSSSWSLTVPRLLALSLLISSVSALDDANESMIYPDPHPEAFRSLSLTLSLIGASVLSFCVARRTPGLRAGASPSRRLLVSILIDSWVFVFSSALMTSGIGLSLNSTICGAAIFLCIIFYGLSKVLIYMFLAERVYTVNAGANRLHSTAYRICLIFLLGFGVVVSLMTWGRIAFIRDGSTHTFPFTEHIMDGSDNACVIGIIRPASISLLVYDLFLNVLFTALFVYPLYHSHKLTPPLRRLAKRTLWAALVALVTSATNVAILMVLHGQELGWVCLGSCTADVTVNALALFFVTGSYDDPQPQKPIDTVSVPVRRRSAQPILQTASAYQPGQSHRSVHFPDNERPDRCTTLDYGMATKSDAANTSTTATSSFSTTVGSAEEDEKPKHHPNDSYINPKGMVTSEGVIVGEKYKVRRKPCIELADVATEEMPKCSTPDGEETEVHIMSVGRSPRTGSRSRPQSRVNSWSRASPIRDLRDPEAADFRADTPEEAAAGGIVSKVMAMFRSNSDTDEGAAATSSVIVSVKTLTEEHIDPVQDPRFDPEQRRWRNVKRASAMGPKGDLETGL
jgi:hypothetical protein